MRDLTPDQILQMTVEDHLREAAELEGNPDASNVQGYMLRHASAQTHLMFATVKQLKLSDRGGWA